MGRDVGLLNRRSARTEDEIVKGARSVADQLDRIADRLEDAVSRLAEEIADPDDHPEARADK